METEAAGDVGSVTAGRSWLVDGSVAGRVQGWSVRRLPYPAKGEDAEYRTDLRLGLAGAVAAAPFGYALTARYTSDVGGRVDAENVLFYNVGTGIFGRPKALRFERTFRPCPPLVIAEPVGKKHLHHHDYHLAESLDPSAWHLDDPAASWDVPLAGGTVLNKAAPVWLAVSRATADEQSPTLFGRPFGLHVEIAGPGAGQRSLPAATKTVLDGIIAAHHAHDGADVGELARRVADSTGSSLHEVLDLLKPHESLLGSRTLLHRHRDGVAWNPADELCVTATLHLADAPAWRLRGWLAGVRGQYSLAGQDRLAVSTGATCRTLDD